MSRIFITGSTDGLGLATARALIETGHEVVFHARSAERSKALNGRRPDSAPVVFGDLSSAEETRSVAAQVNAIGRMDVVIHNAGVYRVDVRGNTPEGHATTLAVNTLAPYLLTALIERPDRLIYLSSGMHRAGRPSLEDIDWTVRAWDASAAYSESKLYLTALMLAVARRWPAVLSNAVDPGWVPTRMGGANAPDNLTEGHLTQTWLAVGQESSVQVSGKYWHHRQQQRPAEALLEPEFPQRVVEALGRLTGVDLPVIARR